MHHYSSGEHAQQSSVEDLLCACPGQFSGPGGGSSSLTVRGPQHPVHQGGPQAHRLHEARVAAPGSFQTPSPQAGVEGSGPCPVKCVRS